MKLDITGSFTALQAANLKSQREQNFIPVVDVHHAYGLLREELEELFDEAREKQTTAENILAELVDIAAMAQKAAEDLNLVPEGLSEEGTALENAELKEFLKELKISLVHRSMRGKPRQQGQEGPRLFEVKSDLIDNIEQLLGED